MRSAPSTRSGTASATGLPIVDIREVTLESLRGQIGLVAQEATLFGGTVEHALATLREIRGAEIAMIFQEPMTALNPVLSIGAQIDESLVAVERLAEPHRESPFGIVTLSVGTAVTTDAAEASISAWLGAADSALYRSKELGRNRNTFRSAA